MIARPPHAVGELAHRFGGAVDPGAPVTVAQGEKLVLAKWGAVTRIVGPGSYHVPHEFGGEGVEAWFVTTRPVVGVKFGGPLHVPAVNAIFGTCTLQVISPERLVTQLVSSGSGGVDGALGVVRAKMMQAAKALAMKGMTDPPDLMGALADGAAPLREAMGVTLVEVGDLTVN